MKIKKIALYQVDIPLSVEYKVSGGRVRTSQDSTVVSIETDEGITGWGESCPWGTNYLPAFATGARAGIAELAPHLIGLNPCWLGDINEVMDKELVGHPYVKTALDMACWDILGKKCGVPVYELMGGLLVKDLPLEVYLPFSSLDRNGIQVWMEGNRRCGIRRFTFKAMGDPEMDIRVIELIQGEMRDGETIRVDANGGWKIHEALRILNAVQGSNMYIEQPCASYEDCKILRKNTSLPIGLDETIENIGQLIRAYHDGLANFVNIKIARVGGITKARQMRDLCVTLGIPVLIQDTGGSEIVTAAIAHLAHSIPEDLLWYVCNFQDINRIRVAEGGSDSQDGKMNASKVPGLGIEPIREVLGGPTIVAE